MKRYLLIMGLTMCFVGIKAQTVDTKIAVNSQTDDKTFVVIVSNENYKNEESVPFAKNDGEVFKVYCQKTLGIPEDHIRFSPDATLGEMNYAIYWLGNMLKAYDGEARAIVYYSGHGMPDESGKEAYLLPVDGFSQSTEGALSTKNLYKKLGDMNSKNIMVFLDACFSGAKRDGKMLASSRGVAIKAKIDPVSDNTVVFSAAQGDETAYPYKSQKHGMFTYYVLEKMQQSGGYTTLGELSDYVTQQVKRKAVVENNGKSQTPTVIASRGNSNWRNWQFASVKAYKYENRSVAASDPTSAPLPIPSAPMRMAGDQTMTKENGMTVINTTTLGKDVQGYMGTTPLKIYIEKNKVVKIEALKNQETPKYFLKVKKALLDKWNGLKVKDAKALKVDAVTGATYSSEAVIENVKLGLDYYQNHKK